MTTGFYFCFLFFFPALFTQQSVGWHGFSGSGLESERFPCLLRGGRLRAADLGQFLVCLWPKTTSSQHLSRRSNHRLTAAITDLVANQSTQTRAHKQGDMNVHTDQFLHKYYSTHTHRTDLCGISLKIHFSVISVPYANWNKLCILHNGTLNIGFDLKTLSLSVFKNP